ncbi:MAG: hypothetical protein JWM93_34 [Frankiales bacterium]|nr:hypothetical protein [Frankiales bacterium]
MNENTSKLRVIASVVGSGIVATLVWGTVTKLLEQHVGYLALAVGAIVGLSVKHIGKSAGIAGGIAAGVVSIIACLAGDLLAVNWLIAANYPGAHPTLGELFHVVRASTGATTYVFYAVSAYVAFRTAGGMEHLRRTSSAAGEGRFTPDSMHAPSAPPVTQEPAPKQPEQ